MLIAVQLLAGCNGTRVVTGYWHGTMEMNEKTVDVTLDLTSQVASFSSNDLMLLDEPISDLKISGRDISFRLRIDAEMLFEGKSNNDSISGLVAIQGMPSNLKISFILTKRGDGIPDRPYSIEKQTIKSKEANLSAELYVPKSKKLHPALVLLHGSSMNLKREYAFYADYFARMGFEVFIYDKRGNGGSTGNYGTASYTDLAEDAIACLEFLKNRPSVDGKKIGLWGYSQGATLLPMIASMTEIPSFLIAKSPEFNSAAEGAAYSDSLQILNLTHSSENARIVAESHRIVAKMISNGSDYREVELFIRQNAQKHGFMDQTGLSATVSINKAEFDGYYWRGRAQNFSNYWENLSIPTLALFGEDDELLNAVRNQADLKKTNNRSITTVLFKQANHNLKKTFTPVTYPDFDWPRSIPGCTDTVEKWIAREVFK